MALWSTGSGLKPGERLAVRALKRRSVRLRQRAMTGGIASIEFDSKLSSVSAASQSHAITRTRMLKPRRRSAHDYGEAGRDGTDGT
jgi:hypothetical protein